MRIPGRVVVAVAAACALFGGIKAAEAAAPPEIFQVYSTPLQDMAFPVAPPTIVTVVGKSLTKFTGFSLTDSFGTPLPGTIDVLFKSKKILVLRLPPDLVDARYIVNGAVGTGDPVSFSVFVANASVAGSINDFDNPLEWSKLKGVPSSIADGVDDNSWTEFNGNIYRAPGNVGVGAASPAAKLHVIGSGGVLFEGQVGEGLVPFSGATAAQMIWAPGKYAFRAGFSNDGSWNNDNVGDGSAAFGYNTRASNFATFAAGSETDASGIDCTALGAATSATGTVATALGGFTDADGSYSLATGYTTATSGFAATSLGAYTSATGSQAVSMGEYTTAQAADSLVLGRYNVVAGTTDQWVTSDPVLVVGNGNAIAASNAFTLLKNGNLTIAGTLTENSDARLKKDVAPLTGVLRRVAGIRGVTYRMQDESRGPAGPQIGLLAQEVREVFPELVQEDSEGTLSVAYGKFSAVLLEAVKEQQAALEVRDRRIEALEERLARLEAKAGE